MNYAIQTVDGETLTADQFRARNRHLAYAGDFPPKPFLDSIGAQIVEIEIPPTPSDINAERDHRLAADFFFGGKLYQRDPTSLQRITGAATLAGFAVANGAQPGDYRWHIPSDHPAPSDFEWIASDNSLTKMDAQTAFAFGQVAANVETRIIFAAKALREMDPIPADYTDDQYWPDTGTI